MVPSQSVSTKNRKIIHLLTTLGWQSSTQSHQAYRTAFYGSYHSTHITFCFCFCKAASRDSNWNCLCWRSFFSLSTWLSSSWIFWRTRGDRPSFHSSTTQLILSRLFPLQNRCNSAWKTKATTIRLQEDYLTLSRLLCQYTYFLT